MRWLIILAAAVSVSACQRKELGTAPATAAPAASEAATATYTIVRICEDGTKIYGPPPYAVWETDKWVNIEGSPASVCRRKG